MKLSRPCRDCPFLKGSSFEVSMTRSRAQEIADSLGGGEMFSCSGSVFPCHKTTTAGGAEKGKEQFCVGALGTMENGGVLMQNQMVQISGRLGMIDDPEGVDYLVECYGSLQEWVDVHEQGTG